MIYPSLIYSIVEVLLLVLGVLLMVAFLTVLERKVMGSMQRRLGPNITGYLGQLQAFADALKLLIKEYVSPTLSNLVLFFLGPIITLIFSLLSFAVIPYGPGLSVLNINLGILYVLAMSSLSTYGILLAGWSANSKYAFLGSLRSTAQLISYELILSSAILIIVFLSGSLNFTNNIEIQKSVWFILPLLPVFIIFFIGCVAETNRAPFDLAEAESELVSGFMTEHSAVIFVFFFLGEYASILFMCFFSSLLFLGGYMYSDILYIQYSIIEYLDYLITVPDMIDFNTYIYIKNNTDNINHLSLYIPEELPNSLSLSLKTCALAFLFIWIRASLPRIRYDQLMSFCWTSLLPCVIALITLIPCIIMGYASFILNYYIL